MRQSLCIRALEAVVLLALAGTAFALHPGFLIGPERVFAPKILVLGLAALSIGILWFAAAREGSLQLSYAGAIFLCYFAVGLASWAIHRPRWVDLAGWLGPEASAAFLFLAVARLSSEDERRQRILRALLAVALIVAALALLEAAGVHLPHAASRRPQSTLGTRNLVGAYTAMALPIAAWGVLSRPNAWRGAHVCLLLLTVLLTRCRGAWLALITCLGCALALTLWYRRRDRLKLPDIKASAVLASSAVLAVALAAYLPWPGLRWTTDSPLLDSLSRIAEYEQGSGWSRVQQYRVGWFIFRDHPLLGVGPRLWSEAAAEYAHLEPGAHVPPWRLDPSPHSELVRIATELGLAGLSALSALVFLAWKGAAAQIRRGSPGAAMAGLCALIVVGIYALVDAPFFHPATLAASAVIAGTLRPAGQGTLLRSPPFGRVALALAGMVAFVLCALPFAAAMRISAGSGSREALLGGQRWFPRPTVSHLLINDWVSKNECERARSEIERAMDTCPHCWGALLLGARCEQRRQHREEAERYRSRALAIEPHPSVLATAHP